MGEKALAASPSAFFLPLGVQFPPPPFVILPPRCHSGNAPRATQRTSVGEKEISAPHLGGSVITCNIPHPRMGGEYKIYREW